MGQRTSAAIAGACLWAVAACGDARAARIAVAADPFVFNGRGAVQIPATVVDARGRALKASVEARSSDADILQAKGSAMECRREGSAELLLRSGALARSLTVHCRPVASFGPPFAAVELGLGDPPAEIPVVAFDSAGRRVDTLRYSAKVLDSTVAQVVDGRIVPRRIGKTSARLDLGGLSTSVAVVVTQRVHEERVQLAAEEYRAWPIDSGRYRARFLPREGGARQPSVTLLSNRANCARLNREPDTLHCLATSPAAVVLRASRATEGTLVVDRMP